MKAVEFESKLTQGGEIALPPEVQGDIPAGEQLRVVVMWDSSGLDSTWRAAGQRGFEVSYCPEDDIYEELIGDAPVR